jgi:hypothetical protein
MKSVDSINTTVHDPFNMVCNMFYRGAIVMVDKKEIGMKLVVGTLGTLGTLGAVAWFGLVIVLVLGKNT